MARGKKAGHVKAQVTIKDEVLAPYYIVLDEGQYTLMTEDSTLPLGYYASLQSAMNRLIRYRNIGTMNQQTLTLNEFLTNYEALTSQILSKINI